jgi:ribosome biogenesis GTPase A
MSNNDFKVAFIGLPSSGKSTIINSLIGKKLLES